MSDQGLEFGPALQQHPFEPRCTHQKVITYQMFSLLNLREETRNFRGKNKILDPQVEELSPTLKHIKGFPL
jgi:hypothetical protein